MHQAIPEDSSNSITVTLWCTPQVPNAPTFLKFNLQTLDSLLARISSPNGFLGTPAKDFFMRRIDKKTFRIVFLQFIDASAIKGLLRANEHVEGVE